MAIRSVWMPVPRGYVVEASQLGFRPGEAPSGVVTPCCSRVLGALAFRPHTRGKDMVCWSGYCQPCQQQFTIFND